MRRGVSFCGGHAGAFERATSPSSEFVNPDAVRAKARTREHGAVCLPLFFLITKKPVPMPVHSRTAKLSPPRALGRGHMPGRAGGRMSGIKEI